MRSLLRKPVKGESPTVADASDAALARAARTNLDAFDALYRRYEAPVLNYCYYRLGHWPDAEDAAQQVFTSVFAHLGRFEERPGGSFRSWLFTIAHNEVANRHRSRNRHPSSPLDDASELFDSGPGPEEHAIAEDEQRRALALLDQLTSDQRHIIELRMAGLTDVEIGALLERSPGAVRAAQFRAVNRLRGLLYPTSNEWEGRR